MKAKTKEFANAVGAVYPVLFMGRHDGVLFTETELETFANLVAAAEREACEMAVEDMARKYQKAHEVSAENVADACAYAIRARGVLAQPEQEPTCPKCKAAVLYECVACSNNNYPPRPEQEPCIGKDPRCPCQDGDACHYKDCGDTKALPVPAAQPAQEPTPWRDMIVATLVREGINKHRARELADHFAAQLKQEPVAFYHPRNGFYWAKPTSIFAPTSVDVEPLPLYTQPSAAAHTSADTKNTPPPEWEWINNILHEYGLQAIDFVADWKAMLGQAEPVAWGVFEGNLHDMFFTQEEAQEMADLKGSHAEVRPLYTAAAQRPWQGLTDEEVQFYRKKHSKLFNAGYDKVTETNLIAEEFNSMGFYKEVSAALKERNT